MPFWGLVITSVGFIVPTVIAFRKARWIAGTSCGVLTITSIAYHSTLHPMAQAVDMVFAHSIGIGCVLESTRRALFLRNMHDIITCSMTYGGIAIYIFKTRNKFTCSSQVWHMIFHAVSQGAWCNYLANSCF